MGLKRICRAKSIIELRLFIQNSPSIILPENQIKKNPENKHTTRKAFYIFQRCMFFQIYVKGRLHKYRIKIFPPAGSKCGVVLSIELYAGTCCSDMVCNTAVLMIISVSK
jgi:hypothetical protein